MDELAAARKVIDECDREVAALFEKRMSTAKEIALYKKEHGLPIYVPKREKELLEKNSALIRDPAVREQYIHVLQQIMNASKRYQQNLISGVRAAHSGITGAQAVRKSFPDHFDILRSLGIDVEE